MARRFSPIVVATVLFIAAAQAQTEHHVGMNIVPIEGRPLPVFYFEPVGLLIEPGDSVVFMADSPHHTATAYHGQHVKSHRVPDGVEPFSSPIVPIGESWSYTFTVPGTYDIWCGPHEQYGMAMRIVVGQPGGPAEAPAAEPGPDGVYGAAMAVLNAPGLASSRIVAMGSVPWADVVAEVLALD